MSLVQILALIKTLGPYAKTVIQFAIAHKAEFLALLAALREVFSAGGLAAASESDSASPADLAAAGDVSEDEAKEFAEMCA